MSTRTTVGTPTLPRVNLLPPEIAEAQRLRRMKLGLGAAVAVSLLAVGGLYYQAHGGVSSAQDELTAAQQENVRLTHELSQYSNVTAMKDQVAAAQGNLQTAMAAQVLWSHYMSDLAVILPGNVWLEQVQVKVTGTGTTAGTAPGGITGALPAADAIGAISIKGSAVTHNDVAAMLSALAKEKGFSNSFFTQSSETAVQNTTKKVDNFQATVDVTLKALSGRYLKPLAGE